MSRVPLDIKRIQTRTAPPTLEGQKLHYSKFHVIWSSNKNPETEAEAVVLVQQMSDIFEEVMAENPADFVKFKVGNLHLWEIDPSQWNTENIKKFKVRFVIEKGSHPKGSRVHLHAIIYMEHYLNLQLSRKVLKDLLCLRLENMNESVKGCFLKITWVPVDKPLLDYIGKNPFNGTGLEGLS